MAANDILLKAGIKFNPKDVDVKAIQKAIETAIANTQVDIAKAVFGSAAAKQLKESFKGITFQIGIMAENAFGAVARKKIRDNFSGIKFFINDVQFGSQGIGQLQKSFGEVQLKVKQAKVVGGARQQFGGQNKGADAAAKSQDKYTLALKKTNRAQDTASQKYLKSVQSMREVTQQVDKNTMGTANYLNLVKGGAQNLDTFGAKIGQITTRFSAYLVSLKALFLMQEAFNRSLKVIGEFDSSLQDLQKVLQTTPEGLAEVSEELFKIANATGQSVKQASESFGIFTRAGYELAEAIDLAKNSLIGANISELSVAESTKFITSAMIIFGDEISGTEQALDILSATADNAATTAGEVGRGFLRAGAAAKAVGVGFGEFQAIIAAAAEATQLSGSRIGSALKTIFARVAANSDKLREQANAYGANVKAGDTFLSIIEKLSAVYPKLNKEQKASLGQIVAGKRRFTEFNAIISSFSKVQELLVVQQNSAGTAARKNAAELGKLSTKYQQLKNVTAEFVTTLAGSTEGADAVTGLRKTFGDLLDLVTAIVVRFNDWSKFIKESTDGFVKISSIFAGFAKAVFIKSLPIVFKLILSIAGYLNRTLSLSSAKMAQIIPPARKVTTEMQRQDVTAKLVNSKLQLQITSMRQMQAEQRKLNAQQSRYAYRAGKAARQGYKSFTGSATGRAIGAVALMGGVQVLTDSLSKFGEEARNSTDLMENYSGALMQSTASALNFSVMVAMLAGPIAGAATAAVIFSVKLIKSILEINKKATEARESFSSVANGALGLADALRIGGETGVEVFKNMLNASQDANKAVVNYSLFMSRLGKKMEGGADSLTKVWEASGEVLEDVIRDVAGVKRVEDINRAFKKAADVLKNRSFEIAAKIDAGGVGTEFAPIIKSTARVSTLLSDITSKMSTLEGRASKTTQLFSALSEQLQNPAKNSWSIVHAFRVSNDEIDEVNTKILEYERKLGTVNKRWQNAQDEVKAYRAEQERLKKVTEAGDKADKTEELSDTERNSLLEQERFLKSQIEDKSKAIFAVDKNRVDIQAQITELEAIREKRSKLLLNNANQLKIELANQVGEANILAEKSTERAKSIRTSIPFLKEDLDRQVDIAKAVAFASTEEEKRSAKVRQFVNKELKQYRKQFRERTVQIKTLADNAEDAASRGLHTQAANMRAAAARLDAELKKEAKEIVGKVKIQVDASVKKMEDIKSLVEREKILKQERLASIDAIIAEETRASARRIDLIKTLSKSASGQEFLKRKFRPSQYLEREFGQVGAMIVKEIDNAGKEFTMRLVQRFQELKDRGASEVELLSARQAAARALQADQEERIEQKRQVIIDRVEEAVDRVKDAEKDLINVRNKIPALNGKVISAEKALATARKGVENAVSGMTKANQAFADASAEYTFAVGLARAKAMQSTVTMSDSSRVLSQLRSSYMQATQEAGRHSNAVINIRRQLAQEELSILKSQINSTKDWAVRLATATEEERVKMMEQRGFAEKFATGRISLDQIPAEFRSGIEGLSSHIDGLEAALTREGFKIQGWNFNKFQAAEAQMVAASENVAALNTQQLNTANEQLIAAQRIILKAEERVELAKQNLNVAEAQRIYAGLSADSAAAALSVQRQFLGDISERAVRQLSILDQEMSNSVQRNVYLQETLKLAGDRNVKIDQLVQSIDSLRAKLNLPANNNYQAVPNAAGGTLTFNEVNALINSARKEKRAMPGGSKLMLANTSEVVLNRRQAGSIGLSNRREHTSNVPHAAEGSFVATATDISKAVQQGVEAAMSIVGGVATQKADVNITIDSNRKVNLKGISDISSEVKRAFESESSKYTTKEEAAQIGKVVDHVVRELSTQGINV